MVFNSGFYCTLWIFEKYSICTPIRIGCLFPHIIARIGTTGSSSRSSRSNRSSSRSRRCFSFAGLANSCLTAVWLRSGRTDCRTFGIRANRRALAHILHGWLRSGAGLAGMWPDIEGIEGHIFGALVHHFRTENQITDRGQKNFYKKLKTKKKKTNNNL